MRHWYYPSSIVGCGLSIDTLTGDELTCVRSEVDCPGCRQRLQNDHERCFACRTGQPASILIPHTCDPGE